MFVISISNCCISLFRVFIASPLSFALLEVSFVISLIWIRFEIAPERLLWISTMPSEPLFALSSSSARMMRVLLFWLSCALSTPRLTP